MLYITEAEKTHITAELEKCQELINSLLYFDNSAIMDHELVDTQIRAMTRKEYEIKERFVLQHHTNTITETKIKKNGSEKTVYQTRLGSHRPRCSTREALIEKLYSFYMGEAKTPRFVKYSVSEVFDAALQNKILEEAPKEKTIRDYRSTFKAFIDDEFAEMDIRRVTASDIKIWLQTVTRDKAPTKKRFLKLKGLLNLIFNYAMSIQIISINPVCKNNKAFIKNCNVTSKRPEDKAFQPNDVARIQSYLWDRVNRLQYDVNGFAILFASYTGVREAEIPALKWQDVKDSYIHIHAQLNDEIRDGKKYYYYNPSTKNEKGISQDGRKFPLTKSINNVLSLLKAKQDVLGIKSEWVFCKKDGSYSTTVSYYEALYKVCKKLNLKLSNNHAFRMALNSYDFIPKGIAAPYRAQLLGHSVEVNLRNYTFAKGDEYLDDLREILDKNITDMPVQQWVPQGTSKILAFPSKENTLESIKFKGLD